jgi:hypothetical protein
MTVDLPGPRPTAKSGVEARRGDAVRRVVEADERLLRSQRAAPQNLDECHNRHQAAMIERGDGEFAQRTERGLATYNNSCWGRCWGRTAPNVENLRYIKELDG